MCTSVCGGESGLGLWVYIPLGGCWLQTELTQVQENTFLLQAWTLDNVRGSLLLQVQERVRTLCVLLLPSFQHRYMPQIGVALGVN